MRAHGLVPRACQPPRRMHAWIRSSRPPAAPSPHPQQWLWALAGTGHDSLRGGMGRAGREGCQGSAYSPSQADFAV